MRSPETCFLMSIHERLGNFPSEYTFIQLANRNSSCFINSILQSLYNIDYIAEYLKKTEKILWDNGVKDENESTIFGRFIQIYMDSQRAPQNEVYYEPNYFLDSFFQKFTQFKESQPDDSSDFFLTLIKEIDYGARQVNIFFGQELISDVSHMFNIAIREQFNGNDYCFSSTQMLVLQQSSCGLLSSLNYWMAGEFPAKRSFYALPKILCIKIGCRHIDNDPNPNGRTPIPEFLPLCDNSGEVMYEFKSCVVYISNNEGSGHFISVFTIYDRYIVGDDTNFWELNRDQKQKFFENNDIPGSEGLSFIYVVFYQKISVS